MPTPGEHKSVQARILECAEAIAIGWTVVSREKAEQRRGLDTNVPPAARAKNRSLFFDHEEKRERDLILIDYEDKLSLTKKEQWRNVYDVTEQWAFHNGHYGTREAITTSVQPDPYEWLPP